MNTFSFDHTYERFLNEASANISKTNEYIRNKEYATAFRSLQESVLKSCSYIGASIGLTGYEMMEGGYFSDKDILLQVLFNSKIIKSYYICEPLENINESFYGLEDTKAQFHFIQNAVNTAMNERLIRLKKDQTATSAILKYYNENPDAYIPQTPGLAKIKMNNIILRIEKACAESIETMNAIGTCFSCQMILGLLLDEKLFRETFKEDFPKDGVLSFEQLMIVHYIKDLAKTQSWCLNTLSRLAS